MFWQIYMFGWLHSGPRGRRGNIDSSLLAQQHRVVEALAPRPLQGRAVSAYVLSVVLA